MPRQWEYMLQPIFTNELEEEFIKIEEEIGLGTIKDRKEVDSKLTNIIVERLNQFGSEGWELVGILPDEEVLAIFKRERTAV